MPAASTWPTRVPSAPVKAPRAWPKSSFSISVGEITAQLTVTKGRLRRVESAWTWRAITPLPVPVSPSRSTVASVVATRLAIASASRSAGLLVSKRGCTPRADALFFSSASSVRISAAATAFCTTWSTWAGVNGLGR